MKRTERRQKIRDVVIPLVNELLERRRQEGGTVEDVRLLDHDTVIEVEIRNAI